MHRPDGTRSPRGQRGARTIVLVAALVVAGLPMAPRASHAIPLLPDLVLTVRVERVTALDDNFGSFVFPDTPDFYGQLTVAGVALPRSAAIDDSTEITPNWEFVTPVDRSQGTVELRLQVLDEDGALRFGDDDADIGLSTGSTVVDGEVVSGGGYFTVDLNSCSVWAFGVDGSCDERIVTRGEDDDAAEVTFVVSVYEPGARANLSLVVERVVELEGFGAGDDPDFYAVATIDGIELPASPTVDDDADIRPNWRFERSVDALSTSVPISLRIYDSDGLFRGDDDEADLTGNGGRALDLAVDIMSCTFTGDQVGSCGVATVSAGTSENRVRVTFRVDVEAPPAAGDVAVECTHSPVWPQPGDPVFVTATMRDLTGYGATRVADSIEVYVDDPSTPVASFASSSSGLYVFIADGTSFVYGCAARSGDLDVFSGYRRVTVGPPEDGGPLVPVYLTGSPTQRIDIVFSPDRDSFNGAMDSDFQQLVGSWMSGSLFDQNVFLVNQGLFNIWVTTDRGVAGGSKWWGCDLEGPSDGLTDTYPFMEAVGILHTKDLRDCAQGGRFSSDNAATITHELGHVPFGLADEYCRDGGATCDGGYQQRDTLPNVYESQRACEVDAANVGRTAADCRSWVSDHWYDFGQRFWTSDPMVLVGDPPRESGDLMVDNTQARALDERRIAWVLRDVAGATTADGAALEPGTAPVPPPLEPPTSKAYVVRGTLDGTAVDVTDVALVRTYGRYAGDPGHEVEVALGTWTGATLGDLGVGLLRDVHAYDESGAPAEHFPAVAGDVDLLVPFTPGLAQLTLVSEGGQSIGSVDLRNAVRDFCGEHPMDPDCLEGYDLTVHSTSATAAGVQRVGQPFVVTTTTDVRNLGPAPGAVAVLDVTLGTTGPLVGAAVDHSTSDVMTGTPWLHDAQFEAECANAGATGLSVQAKVGPGSDERLELDPDDDDASAALDVECVLPVAIDVSPGVTPNRVNAGNGTVHVAVLTTAPGEFGLPLAFDASWIVSSSLVLGTEAGALAGIGSTVRKDVRFEDVKEPGRVRGDGDVDLTGWFTSAATGLVPGQTTACVVGRFVRPDGSGGRFVGCDTVVVLPK